MSVPPIVQGELSFTLREGERLCVYGHSGAGKTTVIRALLGLVHRRGEIVWHVPRSSVGYAAQQLRLIPRANVLQHIMWAACLHGIHLSAHGSRMHELLDRCGLLEKRQQAASRLSVGEKVRLELCCAMAVGSRLLVVDGLLEQLDEALRTAFWEEVDFRCARHELALLYATHSAREAEMADRVLLMHEGRVLALDAPEQLRALTGTDTEVNAGRLQMYFERANDTSAGMHLLVERVPNLEDVLEAIIRSGGWQ